MAKFWKSLLILKNHFKISGKYFEKSLLPNCPDWKENSTMIKKSYVPFYQSLIFFVSTRCCCFRVKKHLYFDFFLPWIFQYYFRIYWKKSQYKSFTTRKQQQLGENKKIRLWSTGNSYLFFHYMFPRGYGTGKMISKVKFGKMP